MPINLTDVRLSFICIFVFFRKTNYLFFIFRYSFDNKKASKHKGINLIATCTVSLRQQQCRLCHQFAQESIFYA